MPGLVHEIDLHADLEAVDVGPGPTGHRMVISMTVGTASGHRVQGTMVGAGADWILIGPDGFARVDVRFTIRTHDDAHIYVQYFGLLEVTPAIQQILGGGGAPTEYGDQYFFTTPRLETGDERYSWVNTSVFVGEGRVLPGPAVEYKVYRVENS